MEAKNLEILGNLRITDVLYRMELEGNFTEPPLPGQFIHIGVEGFFLRRPFSIAGCRNDRIAIIYQVVGRGTEALAGKRTGEKLSVIGPLGNGFPVRKEWKNVYLAGGGTGIAPLLFLAESLSDSSALITFFYGARNSDYIAFKALPPGIGCVFATEDGSYGFSGTVDRALLSFMKKNGEPDAIYAGGPRGFLKKISAISEERKIPAFVSMENRMACGTGLCYGCVTKIKTDAGWEYKRICKEGPVFNTGEIKWE